MKVIYSDEIISDLSEVSLFLAGPTPRTTQELSWRPDALKILEKLNYSGTVLVPERSNWEVQFSYEDQVNWEIHGLGNCQTIVFWVPRRIPDFLGLTTNVEFGFWLAKRPSNVIYGRPENAPHTKYLDWLFLKETKCNPFHSLEDLLKNAIIFN